MVKRKAKKQELKEVKPMARKAISNRLWWMLRFIAFDVTRLATTPSEILENDKFFYEKVNEEHFVAIFEQIEKLIEIYGNRIADDVQNDLMNLGYEAGNLAESIAFVKINFDIKQDFDEWKHFRDYVRQIADDAGLLVEKLEKEELLDKEMVERYKLARDMSLKYQGKHISFLRDRYS